jgi:hypothetical protein
MTTDKNTTERPAKEWNAMKGIMEDTSLPEWQKYYADLEAFKERMQAKKPKRENFESESEFYKAQSEWDMALHCDAPNKPGYYRANND